MKAAGSMDGDEMKTESSITFAGRSPEYQEGYEAGLTPEVYSDDNPYHHRSKKAREWHDGWCDGADEFIKRAPTVAKSEVTR